MSTRSSTRISRLGAPARYGADLGVEQAEMSPPPLNPIPSLCRTAHTRSSKTYTAAHPAKSAAAVELCADKENIENGSPMHGRSGRLKPRLPSTASHSSLNLLLLLPHPPPSPPHPHHRTRPGHAAGIGVAKACSHRQQEHKDLLCGLLDCNAPHAPRPRLEQDPCPRGRAQGAR